MEYISKQEVMEYLQGVRKNLTIQGKDGSIITEIIKALNGFYTYRPTLQSQWVRKNGKDFIFCSRCGFQTLVYKNTKYCPECGRNMVNGKKVGEDDERRL